MYKFWYSTYIRNDPPSSVFILTCASRRATQGPPTESGFILPGLVYMGGSCAFLILQTGLWTRQRASPQPLPYLPVDGRYFCMIPYRGTRSLRHTPKPTPTTSKPDSSHVRIRDLDSNGRWFEAYSFARLPQHYPRRPALASSPADAHVVVLISHMFFISFCQGHDGRFD